MTHLRTKLILLLPALLLLAEAGLVSRPCLAQENGPYLTVGVSIGRIEEGARIFTPIRLLPFEHPEALGHEFPTVLQFHEKEVDALVLLGEHAGLKLRTTLLRYPQWPAEEWAFPAFREMAIEELASAVVIERPTAEAPLPGLRAAAFLDGFPLCFILDTRRLSLEERGMTRPTAMGLDVTRAELLEALDAAAAGLPLRGAGIVVYGE